MSRSRKRAKRVLKRTRVDNTASNLFDAGVGAYLANDNHTAKILIGVAEKLWGESNNPDGAKRARDLYRAI